MARYREFHVGRPPPVVDQSVSETDVWSVIGLTVMAAGILYAETGRPDALLVPVVLLLLYAIANHEPPLAPPP